MDIEPIISEDGMILLKITLEQFQEILYAVDLLNKKRESSRRHMAEKRQRDSKTRRGRPLKQPLDIKVP